jgi:hypothetical protein
MDKSDHKVIFSYASRAYYKATLTNTIRMVRSGKIADTVGHLRETNWSTIMRYARSQPQLATMLYDTIKAADDAGQPLRRLKVKNDQPWMTQSIKLLIKKRQKCFADGNREVAEVANMVKRQIYHRKRTYYRRKVASKRFNPWRLINSHRDQQQRATEDQDLANALNAGFHSVWVDRKQPDISHYRDIAATPPREPVFNEANVTAALNDLNTNSPGHVGLSARLSSKHPDSKSQV